MLLCGSIGDNSTGNTVRLEGSTSCVPGTISTTATTHGVNIIMMFVHVGQVFCKVSTGSVMFLDSRWLSLIDRW